jgi:hypothetical protein
MKLLFFLSFLLIAPLIVNAQWVDITPNNLSGLSIGELDNNIYAGVSGGVYITSDNGLHWIEKSVGLNWTNSFTFFKNGSNIYLGTDIGLYYRQTNSLSWNRLFGNSQENYFVSGIGYSENYLYVGVPIEGVFRRSHSGGEWTNIINGMGNTNLGANAFVYLTPYIYASNFSLGVFRSSNDGDSWGLVNNGLVPNTEYYAMIAYENNVFIGTSRGIYIRSNNDTIWTVRSNGIPEGNKVREILVSGSLIFAGTEGSGIYYSADKGLSWLAVNEGLHDSTIVSMNFNDSNLFAVSSNYRIWKRPLSDFITSVNNHGNGIPNIYSLNQNYPNPFNPITMINFSLADESTVNIKIYNTLGQMINELLNKTEKAGIHSLFWDAENFSSGVYFYKFEAVSVSGHSRFSATKKMILLR